MDPQVPASFIPKKPLDGTGRAPQHGGGGLLMVIALLIFIASLVAAGLAFAYQGYLQSQIALKSSSLQAAQQAFDPSVIADLVRLDSRINNAETLLQNHVAPSALFTFLSTQTLQNVSFTSFSYVLNDDNSAAITLMGQAQDFSAVALQSDQLSASQVLKDIVFSDINVDPQGHVTFTVTATVDPSFINYANNIGTPVGTTTQATPNVPASVPAQSATSTSNTQTTHTTQTTQTTQTTTQTTQ